MPQTLGRLTVALAGLLIVVPLVYAAPGYQHFVVGNPADVVTTTTPLLVLQGGGTDVDENFVRMGAAAGGGDFVVIRASGTDAYNPYISACAPATPWRPSSSRTATRPSTPLC